MKAILIRDHQDDPEHRSIYYTQEGKERELFVALFFHRQKLPSFWAELVENGEATWRSNMNLAEKLSRQIQRVAVLQTEYESLRGPGVNVEFALAHIIKDLEKAHVAQGSGDIQLMAEALVALEDKR